MEGYLLLLAMVATILVVYWAAAADLQGPGKPLGGLFAYRPGREPRARNAAVLPRRDGRSHPPRPRPQG